MSTSLIYTGWFKTVFSRLAYVTAKMGYITMVFVAIDGTKIQADASMRFTGNVAEFRQQRDRIEKKTEKILHHTTDEEPEGQARREKKRGTLEQEKAEIESFLTEVDKEDQPVK